MYIENGIATFVSRKGLAYKRFESLCAGIASAVKALRRAGGLQVFFVGNWCILAFVRRPI